MSSRTACGTAGQTVVDHVKGAQKVDIKDEAVFFVVTTASCWYFSDIFACFYSEERESLVSAQRNLLF